MSFFNDVAKFFSLGTGLLKSGLEFFSEIGNLFTSLFGNNSANAPNANQFATSLAQGESNGQTEQGTSGQFGGISQEDNRRLNELFSVLHREQGATPTT
ncbi:MAG: hypothetical protein ING36_00755 [Burkholderiales bacterium]|jgi:hypothetical protein|nr:hypothetical protein [Burkholderiales bacterium]